MTRPEPIWRVGRGMHLPCGDAGGVATASGAGSWARVTIALRQSVGTTTAAALADCKLRLQTAFMVPRSTSGTVQQLAHGYPVVAVTGPQQSGKTTLVRTTFPDHPYVSLENPCPTGVC